MPLKNDYVNGDVLSATDFNSFATTLNSAEQTANKGQPNGYASLNSSGVIPLTQQTYAVLDGGTSSSAGADVINGGTPASA